MNSALTKDEKLTHCRGCRNDFYNHDGHAMNGTHCWSLDDAKLVTRYAIHFWTPMDTAKNLREVRVLNCYHEEGSHRTVYMERVPSHLAAEWDKLQLEKGIESASRGQEGRR